MAASIATRAMDFATDKVWGDTIHNGMGKFFPMKDESFTGMVVYAIILSIVVVLVKEMLDRIVVWLFPERRTMLKHLHQ